MPNCLRSRLRAALLLGAALLPLTGQSVVAEDAWNPFQPRYEPGSRRPPPPRPPGAEADRQSLPPMGGVDTAPWRQPASGEPLDPRRPPGATDTDPSPAFERDTQRGPAPPPPSERERTVERGELQPVLAGDGSGLPLELWQGIDARNVHTMVTRLEIPPRSPAIHGLWRRLWTGYATPPGGGADRDRFEALRIEALYRSGLLKDLLEKLDADPAGAQSGDPLRAAFAARSRVAAGDRVRGCAEALSLARSRGEIAPAIKTEMLLVGGYCAAANGDAGAASLAAELLRSEAVDAPLQLAALDAAAIGQPFKPTLPKRLSLLDYRFLALSKSIAFADAIERAEPALLVALATDTGLELTPGQRVQAAEMAARLNALDPNRLAEVYRAQSFQPADLAEPLAARPEPALRRALLFKAVEAERTPMKRARAARALLDDSRRVGIYMPAAIILARPLESLAPVPEIGWFAETAIEVHIAAGQYEQARRWIAASAGNERGATLQHWLVLADIADPKAPGPRGASLVHAEQFAVRGRLAPDLMHRLATVLDALDYQIPIPLWEAASRTPQPTSGHLPETGVLTELQDAAKKKEFARTVLLAISTLGPDGADRAQMIALGDAVRALRRAGLEADARRLALEAVFAGWPRMASQ